MLPHYELVDVNGSEIAVRRVGSGPPILALHGFPQTSACWIPLTERLGDRYEFIMPDLPGFGRSDPPKASNASQVAKDIVGLMNALGIERATIIGHDWGGAVAWSLGLGHANRVERLVVINSPFRKLDLKRGWHMLFFNLPVLPEIAFTLAGGFLVETLTKLTMKRRDAISSEAMSEYKDSLRTLERKRSAFSYYRATTRSFIRSMLKIPGTKNPEDPSRKVEPPTLVVWGMSDPVLPGHLIDDIDRWILDLQIERLDGVGHFVPEEAPDELAASIRKFLAD